MLWIHVVIIPKTYLIVYVQTSSACSVLPKVPDSPGAVAKPRNTSNIESTWGSQPQLPSRYSHVQVGNYPYNLGWIQPSPIPACKFWDTVKGSHMNSKQNACVILEHEEDSYLIFQDLLFRVYMCTQEHLTLLFEIMQRACWMPIHTYLSTYLGVWFPGDSAPPPPSL